MFRSLSTLVLLLLFALPGVAFAQNVGKLSGRVTDGGTGETLIGANVYIESVQRGAATDIDGNYTILGLPVGSYDVRFSYAGFETQLITGVEINAGRTRQLDVVLGVTDLGIVEVVYERPLIQQDAIGVPRVASREQINNLPVRGVNGVAAIQPGVVSNDGSSGLNIRGGREQEVDYYVDGVRVVGALAVPQQAIEEQEMLIGTIPPQYGDATAGVISISTRSGGNDFFGAVEAITSEGLDSYGYNLGSLSLGGPIIRNRAGFFLSLQGTYQRDDSPWAVSTLQLNDDLFAQLQSSPQLVVVSRTAANGDPIELANPLYQDDDFYYVPFPAFDATRQSGISNDSLAALIGVPASAIQGAPVSAIQFLGDPNFYTSRRGKDDPSRNLAANGNLTLTPISGVNVRLGGSYGANRDRGFSFGSSLFNRDRYSQTDDQTVRGYGSLRQVLSNTAFYQLQGEYTTRFFETFPEDFGNNLTDLLTYGDIDNEYNQVAGRYRTFTNGQWVQSNTDGNIIAGSAFGQLFTGPGGFLASYSKGSDAQFRVFGNAQTQVGVHELNFGGEYESRTSRRWSINSTGARQLARYFDDGRVEAGSDQAVARYSELPFGAFNNVTSYYGYDYLGLNEVDSQSIGDFTNPDAEDGPMQRAVAPYNPIYYGGYVRDRIEYRDLVIDLGLRVDVFDNNTLVLRDPYSLVDIYRVSDIRDGVDVTAPGGIFIDAPDNGVPSTLEGDYAVYVGNGGQVAGYRDLSGNFYDVNGQRVDGNQIFNITRAGSPVQRAGVTAVTDASFTEYEPQLTIMPRLGVTFPVTDRALFFASYNVTSQRPSENAFASIQTYEQARQTTSRIGNPNLKPEVTTQYELGFRQRVGQQAAVTLSGFYRTQQNKITVRSLQNSFPINYSTFTNQDFTTTKGVEMSFDLRRTRNLAVNANYTLSFAEGTGSDAQTAGTIAWRNPTGQFPETLAPLSFDQRHNLNVSLDYRFARGEGPMVGGVRPFEGFGFNILGTFKSGNPYTQLDIDAQTSPTGQSTNGEAVGAVNAVRAPSTTRLDLKVDRDFSLGAANLRGYLLVQNLLDTRQVVGVYRTTGLPDDDGYLSTPDGQLAIANQPNAQQQAAYQLLYQQYTQGPFPLDTYRSSNGSFYGLPRRIRLGVQLDF